MKSCTACNGLNPENARYCMHCGHSLPQWVDQGIPPSDTKPGQGLGIFLLTLLGSIGLSLILVFVFGLPIFFIAGFLPLFWLTRKTR